MKIAIYTLGCKVNQYETQAMETILRQQGGMSWNLRSRQMPISSIPARSRRSAIKSRQMIRRARRRSPDAVVAVCGCYAQTSRNSWRSWRWIRFTVPGIGCGFWMIWSRLSMEAARQCGCGHAASGV